MVAEATVPQLRERRRRGTGGRVRLLPAQITRNVFRETLRYRARTDSF